MWHLKMVILPIFLLSFDKCSNYQHLIALYSVTHMYQAQLNTYFLSTVLKVETIRNNSCIQFF